MGEQAVGSCYVVGVDPEWPEELRELLCIDDLFTSLGLEGGNGTIHQCANGVTGLRQCFQGQCGRDGGFQRLRQNRLVRRRLDLVF